MECLIWISGDGCGSISASANSRSKAARSSCARFAERISELLDLFDVGPVATASRVEAEAAPPSPEALGSFGEFLLRLPSSATDVDKMLAAGYFVQVGSADDAFTTADANRRLTEQGIKLGNPSQCVKQSLLAKRVFLLSKGRYRVSQQGRAHLRQLLGPVVPD